MGPMAILSIWTGLGPKVANSNEKAPKVLERFWCPDFRGGGLDPLGGRHPRHHGRGIRCLGR